MSPGSLAGSITNAQANVPALLTFIMVVVVAIAGYLGWERWRARRGA